MQFLSDFHNFSQCQIPKKYSLCIYDWKFHLTSATLLHYLVKFENQNIQYATNDIDFPQMLTAFHQMCVMFKRACLKCLAKQACTVSCAIPWLQCQSLTDQDNKWWPKIQVVVLYWNVMYVYVEHSTTRKLNIANRSHISSSGKTGGLLW